MNETRMTKKAAHPLSISLPKADEEKVRSLAKLHGVSLSAILRLALRAGMPLVENQLGRI
jgi:hypothetical protein